jgi:hypothetical protein
MNVSSRLALSLQRFTQSNRSYTESLADQRVRDGAALGFIEIDTAGESVATIGFPMLFVERPVFTYGLELGESSYLAAGSFPIVSACVASWTTKDQGLSTMYAGATVGILVTGPTGKAILHYSFQARSYVNPVGATTSMEAPI